MSEHIVLLDDEGLAPSTRLKRPDCAHTWQQFAYTYPEQMLEHLKDATIAFTCSVPLRVQVFNISVNSGSLKK